MTDNEFVSFGVSLCEKWPDKYDDGQLRGWKDRFKTYPLGYALEALSDWKNGLKSHYPPRPDEIEELVKLKLPVETKAKPVQRSSVIATGIARANPNLAHHSDASLHLIYHRQIYLDRVKDISRLAVLRGRDLDPQETAQVVNRGAQCQERCKLELIGFGIEVEAGDMALRVTRDAECFRALVAEVDALIKQRQEEPEYAGQASP
jgi:hypothetical protein